MTTNLIETPQDIPLKENMPFNMEIDENSGFPFDDRDFDRDRSNSSFRTQLDDLAKRHPEFAEHLNLGGNFPFRSHTLGRRRRDSDNDKPSGSQDAEFRRYSHDRPFSRFDNFNFPFRQYFEDDVPDFYEPRCSRGPEQQQQPQYSYTTRHTPEEAQPQQQQKSQPSSPQPSTGATEKPPQIPRFEGRKPNIQQSNTVDLGQKQEPVDENRGQRSMSAPPENRSTGQRFVSSINIPIQRPSGGGDMGAKASTQDIPQQQTNKPNERVIPIHVEGRDEPIIPKNANTTFTQPPPQPQGERIFGRNPTHFTQFLNKGEPHGMSPEEHYRQQQQQYQKQQQENFQQQQQQQQRQQQQQQQQQQTENAEASQSQPQQTASFTLTQLDQIQNIQKDVSALMNQVEKFNGKPRDKEYLYLDEMLTRNLIKLDNIETEGKDNIRQARKEAIKCIEGCIGILEAKAHANLQAEQKMEVEKVETTETQADQASKETTEKPSENNEASQLNAEQQPAALEISGVSRTGSVANVTTPMEVTEETKKEVPTETQETEKAGKLEESTTQKDAQPKVEEKKSEETDETKKDELKNIEASAEKMEVSSTTEANPNSDPTQDDKKEKKKGKKKEKTEKTEK